MARLIAMVDPARIETLASSTYHERHSAVMLLVTNNPLRASEWLRAAGFRVAANSVGWRIWRTGRGWRRCWDVELNAAGVEMLYSCMPWTAGQPAWCGPQDGRQRPGCGVVSEVGNPV
jgi:hypothetical protein